MKPSYLLNKIMNKHKTSNTLKLMFKFYTTTYSYMFYVDDTHIGFNFGNNPERLKRDSKIFKYIKL